MVGASCEKNLAHKSLFGSELEINLSNFDLFFAGQIPTQMTKAVKEGVFCKVGAGIGFDWSGWEEEVG